MGSIPFTLYDFFGYLAAGALWLIGVDYAFKMGWLLGRNPGTVESIYWIIAAYAIGHINANVAAWVLEDGLLHILGRPAANLFRESDGGPFRHYKSPLPVELHAPILEKYKGVTGQEGGGEAMFLYCFHQVKERCPNAFARINIFVAHYGFARNMALAALGLGVILGVLAVARGDLRLGGLALSAALGALALVYRFLKFYRLTAKEVFLSFLTGVPEKS